MSAAENSVHENSVLSEISEESDLDENMLQKGSAYNTLRSVVQELGSDDDMYGSDPVSEESEEPEMPSIPPNVDAIVPHTHLVVPIPSSQFQGGVPCLKNFVDTPAGRGMFLLVTMLLQLCSPNGLSELTHFENSGHSDSGRERIAEQEKTVEDGEKRVAEILNEIHVLTVDKCQENMSRMSTLRAEMTVIRNNMRLAKQNLRDIHKPRNVEASEVFLTVQTRNGPERIPRTTVYVESVYDDKGYCEGIVFNFKLYDHSLNIDSMVATFIRMKAHDEQTRNQRPQRENNDTAGKAREVLMSITSQERVLEALKAYTPVRSVRQVINNALNALGMAEDLLATGRITSLSNLLHPVVQHGCFEYGLEYKSCGGRHGPRVGFEKACHEYHGLDNYCTFGTDLELYNDDDNTVEDLFYANGNLAPKYVGLSTITDDYFAQQVKVFTETHDDPKPPYVLVPDELNVSIVSSPCEDLVTILPSPLMVVDVLERRFTTINLLKPEFTIARRGYMSLADAVKAVRVGMEAAAERERERVQRANQDAGEDALRRAEEGIGLDQGTIEEELQGIIENKHQNVFNFALFKNGIVNV